MTSPRILLLVALFGAIATQAAEFKPLGVISTKNFNAMMEAAGHVQKAVEQTEPDLRQEFLRRAGNPDGAGIDMERPWHFVFAPPTPPSSRGVNAFYIPVTKFREFKNALQDDGMFKGRGNANVIRKSGKYAVIIQRTTEQPELGPDQVKTIADYRKQLPVQVDKVYRVHLRLTDEVRTMLKGGLQFFRTTSTAQFQNAAKDAPSPFAGLSDIMGLYFDLGEKLVDGLSELEIDADVTAHEIRFSERITAVPGTELARLMTPRKTKIGHLARYLDGDATILFIGHVEGSDFLKELAAKAMTLGMQLQGGKQDETVTKKMQDMMGRMLPMTFAASVQLAPQMKMAGVYEFPKMNAKQMKQDLADFIDFSTKAQVGKDGLYSSFEREEGVRRIKGVSVDRVTANINTNAAMLKIPGQLNAFRLMWPDDKVSYEIATQDRQMFYALGVPMEQALAPAKSPTKLRVEIDDDTFVAGRYNILNLITQWLPQQRGMPAAMVEAAKKLDSKGAGVDMKASLDGAFSGEMVVPMKLLTQFSRLGKEMAKARPKATAEPKAP